MVVGMGSSDANIEALKMDPGDASSRVNLMPTRPHPMYRASTLEV
jgi:hypothetical protein